MRTKGSKNGTFGNKINKEQFESLCKIQCTRKEICAVLGVCEYTLYMWMKQQYGEDAKLEDIMEDLSATGKASLRRIQWQHAEKNPAMAMFLGKNYLGQSDKPAEVESQLDSVANILVSIKKVAKDNVD